MTTGVARITTGVAIVMAVAAAYMVGRHVPNNGESLGLLFDAQAVATEQPSGSGWSPTKPYPDHEVYYPGTEELGPDEMRVIACGSGMPMPRLKQAAASFLVELGNGDKFIFDVGTGAFTTLYSLVLPLDYMTKIFISHQHADHMGDLPTLWIYGMQNGRSKPLDIWDPGVAECPMIRARSRRWMAS